MNELWSELNRYSSLKPSFLDVNDKQNRMLYVEVSQKYVLPGQIENMQAILQYLRRNINDNKNCNCVYYSYSS